MFLRFYIYLIHNVDMTILSLNSFSKTTQYTLNTHHKDKRNHPGLQETQDISMSPLHAMATVWRGSTPSPIWAPWSLITIPGLQTPWLSSRRHSSICTSWECSGKEHLREAAGDFLPLYHREHPNLPHHGVVLPLHWGRQEEATESGRDSTEDHRMAPLFPQRHLLILLTQQCWVNHKRQHPSRTSPVRRVTLWQALQVHQNQNKQTQKQLLSTSHHCTEHKRALTMTGTHASTPMHARTHTSPKDNVQ